MALGPAGEIAAGLRNLLCGPANLLDGPRDARRRFDLAFGDIDRDRVIHIEHHGFVQRLQGRRTLGRAPAHGFGDDGGQFAHRHRVARDVPARFQPDTVMCIADAQGTLHVVGVEAAVEQLDPMVGLGGAGMSDPLDAAEHRHQIRIGFDMGVELGQNTLKVLYQ